MAFNEFLAVRSTPFYAKKVPWIRDLDQISGLLGYKGHFPDAKQFVRAVSRFQKSNRLLADGILGPRTYRTMKPMLKTFANSTFMGPDPEWVSFLKNFELPPPAPVAPITPAQSQPTTLAPNNEDLVIKEMTEIMIKQRDNMYPAYEVSSAFVADAMLHSTMRSATTSITLVPTIEVGQKWEMKGGSRIVLCLESGNMWNGGLAVLFVTDSGKTYSQTLRGWAADATSAFFTGLSEAMKPIKLILDIEAYLLIGAISASGFTGFAVVASTGATQWVLNNKDKLASWIRAAEAIYDARKFMKANTPILYDKVFEKIKSQFLGALGEIPDSAISDPKNMARLIGGILYQAGKAVLLRDFSVAGEIFSYFLKVVMTAVRAMPSAISASVSKERENTAQNLLEKLKASGISISLDESLKILSELTVHGNGAEKHFYELEEAFRNLK